MYQYQALTHKRRAMRQQDAVLIGGKIIQNKGLISTVYVKSVFLHWGVGRCGDFAKFAHYIKGGIKIVEKSI